MHESMHAVSDMFKMNTGLFANGVEGVEDATALERPSTSSNPILWIAGHVTGSRAHLLKTLGVEKPLAWAGLFNEKYDVSKTYPSFGEVVTAWKDVSETLLGQIARLTAKDLEKKIEDKLPTEDRTVRGAMVFWMYHESWHLGQIAYAKRCLGMEGLVPY